MGRVFSLKRASAAVGRRVSVLLLAILGVALTLAPALVSAQVAGLGAGINAGVRQPGHRR